MIDEEGNVSSANAVSGHPLLRAAAVEAALGARFSPTRLMDNPVKVSGVIVYNFVGAMTPGSLGYEIGYAERAGMFAEYSFPKSLATRLPEDWRAEKEMLESLTYEAPVDQKVAAKGEVPDPLPNKNVYIVSHGSSIYAQRKLTPQSIESLRQLQSAVETRLSGEEIKQWHFKLGKALGVFVAEIKDDNKMRINVAELEQLSANKPSIVSAAPVARLNELIEQAKTTEPGVESRKTLVEAAKNLRNLRIPQW